jgi:hypothetical protein
MERGYAPMKITVETIVKAPMEDVWRAYEPRRYRAVERRVGRLAYDQGDGRPA